MRALQKPLARIAADAASKTSNVAHIVATCSRAAEKPQYCSIHPESLRPVTSFSALNSDLFNY